MTGTSVSDAPRSYRTDIDGLRALAVILVVLYHVGVPWVSGGYIGVDVFFVISGFLITGLLVSELDRTGRISLREFWARRVRRLLPLAGLVIVVTAVVGYALLAPLLRERMLIDALASLFYVANLRYAAQATAYSDAQVTDSLYLHYWTLSVEEQFYVLWPLLIVAVAWLTKRWWPRRRHAWIAGTIAVVVAVSLAASITLTAQLGPEAYYLPQTRFWELGVGALLALFVHRIAPANRGLATATGALGVALVVGAALVLTTTTSYPGVAAVAPVLGAALIIASAARANTWVSRVLSWSPVRAVGRWSYAWYLWHWPAIGLSVLAARRWDWPWSDAVVMAAAGAASLVLAAASHYVIENPLRFSPALKRSVGRTFAMGAAAMSIPAIVIAAFMLVGNIGNTAPTVPTTPSVPIAPSPSTPVDSPSVDPGQPSPLPPLPSPAPITPRQAANDWVSIGPEGCHTTPDESQVNLDCWLGDPDASHTAVLMGDSHARHWVPALHAIAEAYDWRILVQTKQACTPFDVAIRHERILRPYTECQEWSDAFLDALEQVGPIDLVVLGRAGTYADDVLAGGTADLDQERAAELWADGAERTFTRLDAISERIVVLVDTPWAPFDVPTCVSEHLDNPDACAFDLTEDRIRGTVLEDAERSVAPASAEFVDLTPVICPDGRCAMVSETGLIKYRDTHHLTQTYALTLRDAVAAALGLDGSRPGD